MTEKTVNMKSPCRKCGGDLFYVVGAIVARPMRGVYRCSGCDSVVEAEIIRGPSGVEKIRRCPGCGSESQNYYTTSMGCLGRRDANNVQCQDCGWKGKAWEMDEAARAARGGE